MAKHTMKRRTKYILSIALAIVALGSVAAFKFGHDADSHAERFVSHMQDDYSLDTEQTAALNEFKTLAMQMRIEMKRTRQQNIEQVIDLVFQPKLDQQQALSMLQDKTQSVEDKASELIVALANFSDRLNQGQKLEMRSDLENKMNKWRRWHD
jgi:hypothetical protein